MKTMIVLQKDDEQAASMTPDVDLRLLRMFAALARLGSYTRAGQAMNLTQSAISHGIKRLEDQLGCALIHKKGKTAHPTPEGRHFLEQILRVLESLDRATDSISKRGASRSKLTLALSTSIAQAILAPVLREFRECCPDVLLGIRLCDTPEAVREIEEGRADLAIVIDGDLPAGLKSRALFRDQLQLMFTPQHRWSEKKQLAASDLKDEHFLLYQRNSVSFQRTEDYFLRSGVRLQSYVEIPSYDIMKQLARLGLGVAIMAPWAATKEIQEGSLIALPLPKSKIVRQWSIACQAGREIRQTEQTFIGLCRLATAELMTGND
jgi:DNA-binding transcriptional LysR family regulator